MPSADGGDTVFVGPLQDQIALDPYPFCELSHFTVPRAVTDPPQVPLKDTAVNAKKSSDRSVSDWPGQQVVAVAAARRVPLIAVVVVK